jgi:hypothetical protein
MAMPYKGLFKRVDMKKRAIQSVVFLAIWSLLLMACGCLNTTQADQEPSLPKLLPQIMYASFDTKNYDESRKEFMSNSIIAAGNEQLLKLVKQSHLLKTPPTNAPLSPSEWKISASYQLSGFPLAANIYYYPENHLLCLYYSHSARIPDNAYTMDRKEPDCWAQTTPELDDYLQKAITHYQNKNKK